MSVHLASRLYAVFILAADMRLPTEVDVRPSHEGGSISSGSRGPELGNVTIYNFVFFT